jgi:stringent starvation protein B
MTPNRPYLVRALYEWITDNALIPYLLVNATVSGCRLPEAHVKDGRIVFNIAFDVVQEFLISNEGIEFTARFSGIPTYIYIPMAAVAAIYAKENGEGMAFPDDMVAEDANEAGSNKKGKPNLKIVE